MSSIPVKSFLDQGGVSRTLDVGGYGHGVRSSDPHFDDVPDASFEYLWQRCTERQRDAIRDGFMCDNAADLMCEIEDDTLAGWGKRWLAYRDEKLSRMTLDGQIGGAA